MWMHHHVTAQYFSGTELVPVLEELYRSVILHDTLSKMWLYNIQWSTIAQHERMCYRTENQEVVNQLFVT